MKNLRHRTKGFTLVEIMIVVLIIGVLMAIAIPNFLNARKTSQTNACIANLKQIQSANEQYAIANKGVYADDVATLSSYLKSTPVCPAGGTYTFDDTTHDPKCGIEGHELPQVTAAQ